MLQLIVLFISLGVFISGKEDKDQNNQEEVFEKEFQDWTTVIKPEDRITEPIQYNQDNKHDLNTENIVQTNSKKIKNKTNKSKKKNCENVKKETLVKKNPKPNSFKSEKKESNNLLFNNDKGSTLIIPRSIDNNFESFVENQKAMNQIRPKDYQKDAIKWYNKNINFINACILESYGNTNHALLSKDVLPEREIWPYIVNKIIDSSTGEIQIDIRDDGLLIKLQI